MGSERGKKGAKKTKHHTGTEIKTNPQPKRDFQSVFEKEWFCI
jgi:hypothetical protein